MVGRTLGHYLITAELGAGGMGVVYRARDERLARDVALKVIRPGALLSDLSRRRFRKEALALSQLNHPNIATIHDFDSQDGVDFVVMELLDGQPLSKVVRERKLAEAEILRIGQQVVAALEEAHEHGIVHRDLKPGNVMLGSKGQAKLVDFGLATGIEAAAEAEATMTLTITGSVSGTLPYMSPEQVRGEPIDGRSDIWAAGAVLYEMATGQRPFPERNQAALIGAILHRTPEPAGTLNPDISPGLDAIITRAMEKEAVQRFQSAGEMQAALDQALLSSQTFRQLRRAVPRPHGVQWLPLVAAAALLAVAAIGWYALRPAPIAPATHVVVLVGELANRTGEPVFDRTLEEFLETGLEQSRTVSVFPSTRLRDALQRMQRPPTTVIDEATGREICQREGLHAAIVGSISKLGTSYVLLARAVSPGGVTLASAQRTADTQEDVLAEMDAVVQALRTGLGESASSVKATSAPLAQVTSPSLDAVRYLTLGKQRLDAADPAEAVTWFEKAISFDTSFAMARGYLGIAYQNLNRPDRAEEELGAAARLSARVTETERLKILGDYNLLIGDYEAGCSAFLALSRLTPEDPAPFHGLGLCHARRRQWAEALAANERALALLAATPTRHNVARTNLATGQLDRARELAEAIIRDAPGYINAKRIIGRVYELRGETAEAARLFNEMIAAGGGGLVSGRLALADLHQATGRFREALPLFEGLVSAAEARGDAVAAARARIMMAEQLAENGARDDAARVIAALGTPPSDPALIMRMGRSYARMGRLAEARRMLGTMRQIATAKPNPHVRSFEEIIAAALAAAEGHAARAVDHASAAATLEASVLAVDELARANDAAGRAAEAIRGYEAVLQRAAERADLDDDPSFRRVVEIHYRLGVMLPPSRRADARRHLETFLGFWKDADAGLAMKADAQQRLRALRPD